MRHLAGIWYSELGSKLELEVSLDGRIDGTYHPVVGTTVGTFRLIGMTDVRAFNGCRSFGFVVSWNNDYVNNHSVTAWSGQYHKVDDEEFLTTTWLLTRETHLTDRWSSTLIGSDTFRREAPASVHKHGASRPEPEDLVTG